MHKCAVLLAVYNGISYIEEQVQSILNQTNTIVTLFISIDDSTDGSEDWCETLSNQNTNIVVLPSNGKSGSASKNFYRLIRDVDFSEFDYIAFADQDDYWYPNKLDNAFKILAKNQYDAYSSNVIAFWPDGKKRLIKKSQAQLKWDFLFQGAGPGCTYVLKKKLMNEIKACAINNWDQLQQIQWHDWFCYAFARAKNYKWFIDPVPYMLYRQHQNNQFGANVGLKAHLWRLRQLNNGWIFKQAILIAELSGVGKSEFLLTWKKMKRLDLLRLSTNAFQCRRALHEQFIFMLICFVFAIIGIKQAE